MVLNELQVKLYVLLGSPAEDYWKVADSFAKAVAGGIYLDKIPNESAGDEPEESRQLFTVFPAIWQIMCWSIMRKICPEIPGSAFPGQLAAYIGQIFKRDIGRSFFPIT